MLKKTKDHLISPGQITVAVWWDPTIFTPKVHTRLTKVFPMIRGLPLTFYFTSDPCSDCKYVITVYC